MSKDDAKKRDWFTEIKPRIKPLLNGDPVGPMVAEVAPTYGCNHACLHCGFQQYDPYTVRKRMLPLKIFKEFADDFHALGGREIWFAGNGEPLLNNELADMVEYGSALGIRMAISSNGVPLSTRTIERIAHNLAWIKFSINGGTAGTHHRVHQGRWNDFDLAIGNIEETVEFRNNIDSKMEILIQFIVLPENWDSITDMVDIHHRIGTDKLQFRNAIRDDVPLAQIPDNVRDTLTKADTIGDVEVMWASFNKTANSNWDTCYGINFRINVDESGELYTCCRNLVTPSTYGNIFSMHFRDIWQSDRKNTVFNEVYAHKRRERCAKWCQCARDNKYIDSLLQPLK